MFSYPPHKIGDVIIFILCGFIVFQKSSKSEPRNQHLLTVVKLVYLKHVYFSASDDHMAIEENVLRQVKTVLKFAV